METQEQTASNNETTTPDSGPIVLQTYGNQISTRELERVVGHDKYENETEDPYEGIEDTRVEEPQDQESDEEVEKEEEGDDTEKEEDKDEKDSKDPPSIEKADIKVEGKGVTVRLEDGKEVAIPRNAKILHKVDGEVREINLLEALNREAGELTIEQRLSKIAEAEHNMKSEVQTYKTQLEDQTTFLNEITEAAKSDTPEVALMLMAERAGKTPGEMYETVLLQAYQMVQHMQEKGMSLDQARSKFAQIDRDYFRWKEKRATEKQQRDRGLESLQQLSATMMEKAGVSEEEYFAAANELIAENAYAGMEDQKLVETTIDRVFQHKHDKMIAEAVKGTGLEKDAKTLAQLKRVTDPKDWTVDEIKTLVREFQTTSATTTRAKPTVDAPNGRNVAKQGKKESRTVRSHADLQRLFKLK